MTKPLLPDLYEEATAVYREMGAASEDAREWFKIRVAVAGKIDQLAKSKGRAGKASGNRLVDDGGFDDGFPDIE
jgi:hypothetical protein